jgi:glycosyltransferase 2 family protein
LIQQEEKGLTAERSRPASKIFYSAIAIALAAVLLYFSLRGIDWRRVGHILAGAKLLYVFVCCLLCTTALFLRAYRWRILLRAEGDVSVPSAFWATSAGYFGNNFLPARAGEVVRSVMISSRARLSKTFVLTTALSERLADAIALVTISALVLLTLPSRPGWLSQAAKPFAIIGALGLVALAVLPYLEKLLKACTRIVRLPERLECTLHHMIEHVLRGIKSFHHPGRLSGFLGLTGVIWFLDALTTMMGAKALSLTITLPNALLLIAGLGLGSALPSTPGYVGVYQFVAVNVLTPFGVSRTDAIAYILFYQALQYVVIGFWGILAFTRRRQSIAQVPEPVEARSASDVVSA